MAKKQISRRKRKRKPKTRVTTHVPLCALGKVIEEKQVFAPIYHQVRIDQKSIDYRPTDKLIFATLGIVAGAETINDVNIVLRPNRPLLAAFGYSACADQSVIQQTINVATLENVSQLECAIDEIWQSNNRIGLLTSNEPQKQPVTIDIDLSPLPISKHAQGSLKGYVAKRKNLYTRQMARVLVPQTQEIVTQSLYAGNTKSCSVLKEMIGKMESVLQLHTKAKRRQICLRLDAGFCARFFRPPAGGTTKNINKGEYRHKLPRRIFFADQGEFTTGDYEEIMNKASCLSLVSNAILYWNTTKISSIVENLRQQGEDIDSQILPHISLLPFKHVIPNGAYFIEDF